MSDTKEDRPSSGIAEQRQAKAGEYEAREAVQEAAWPILTDDAVHGVFRQIWQDVAPLSGDERLDPPDGLFDLVKRALEVAWMPSDADREDRPVAGRPRSAFIGGAKPATLEIPAEDVSTGEMAGGALGPLPSDFEGLPGNAAEVRLQLRALLRGAAEADPQKWVRVVGEVVLPTLLRLEALGEPPDDVVDIAVECLFRSPRQLIRVVEEMTPPLATFASRKVAADPNFLKTIGSLGDVLQGSDRHGGLYGVEYYVDVLCRVFHAFADPEGKASHEPEMWEVIEIDLNNIASRMARFATRLAPDSRGRVREVTTRCNTFATLAGLTIASLRDRHDDVDVELPSRLRRSAPEGATSLDVLRILTRIGSSSDSAGFPAHSRELVLGNALSGVARALLTLRADTRQRDRVAAPLFNAGVTLIGMPRELVARRAELRMFVNALGLFLALKFYEGAFEAAMTEGDGLDCAVNLFGALVDYGRAGPLFAAFEPVAAIFETVLADPKWRRHSFANVERLNGSWDRLRLPRSTGRADASSATAVTAAALDALRGALAPDAHPDIPTAALLDDATAFASVTEAAVSNALFGEDAEARDAAFHALGGRLASVLDLRRDPRRAFLEFWRPMHPHGPLVAAQIVSAQDWEKRVAASSRPCESVARAFETALLAVLGGHGR